MFLPHSNQFSWPSNTHHSNPCPKTERFAFLAIQVLFHSYIEVVSFYSFSQSFPVPMSNDCGCSCRSYFTGIHSLQQAEKLLVEQFEQRKVSTGLQLIECSKSYSNEWKLYLNPDCSARSLLSLQDHNFSGYCAVVSYVSSNDGHGIQTVRDTQSIIKLLLKNLPYIPKYNSH